jgi:hypothetical protein
MTPPRTTSPRTLHDEAGLIGKIALLWIIVLLLLGLLLLDGLSIVLATFKLSNTAQAAASTAATAYKNTHDLEKACVAAEPDLLHDNVPVPEDKDWCKIDADTGTATIVLHTSASTIVLGRISATQDFTKIKAKETAEPASL